LIWFHSSHKRQRDFQSRQDAINRALKGLSELKAKLEGPRCRYSTKQGVADAAEKLVHEAGASQWLAYEIEECKEESFLQETRGCPGNSTRWRRKVKIRYRLSWNSRTDRIASDRAYRQAGARTDGIFPLVTNDRKASMLEVLTAYKSKQPLIERHLRMAMANQKIKKLPLYPEGRQCRTPTMARLIDNFEALQRHVLLKGRTVIQQFAPELTDLHRKLLDLLGLSTNAYQNRWEDHAQ